MLKQLKEITVVVTNDFCMQGEPVPVDTVLSLEYSFAMELIHSNKAKRTDEAPRAPRPVNPEPKKATSKAAKGE